MNKPNLAAPILLTTAFATAVVAGISCSKSEPPADAPNSSSNIPPATESSVVTATNAAAPGTPGNPNGNLNLYVTNEPATNASAAGENWANNTSSPAALSPGSTDTNSQGTPATPAPAPSETATGSPVTTVEMPVTTPEPPKNFYSACMETNCGGIFGNNPEYVLHARVGYQHIYHGDNNDTWYAGLKFYAHPDSARERIGKNGWIIPDADLEFSHQDVAKPDQAGNPGSAQGLNLRGSFTWSWVKWTTTAFVRENCPCPYAQPLNFTLGPTVNLGFDYTFESNDARFARYAGARLTVNREAFVEYTVGATDGLPGTRQQALVELPFYITRDQLVRYEFRGLWNHGIDTPDVLEAGVFMEMPLDLFVRPRQWGDLVPFIN